MPFTVPASSLSAGESAGGRMKHKKHHRTHAHHPHHRHHHAHMTAKLMRGHGMSLGEASHQAAMMRVHHKVAGSGLHAPGFAGKGMHAAGAKGGAVRHRHHKKHGARRKCGHCRGSGMRRSGTGQCGHCHGTGFWDDFGNGFKKGFFGTLSLGAPLIGALSGNPAAGMAVGNLANGLSGL